MKPYLDIMGAQIDLYKFFNFFGWVVLVAFNATQIKKKKDMLSKISLWFCKKAKPERQNSYTLICAWAETLILSCVQFFPGILLMKAWGTIFTSGASNYFGLVVLSPFIFMSFCIIFRIPILKQLDLYAPSYALSLVCFKIACFCAGCCYGVSFKHGIWNQVHYDSEFPVQLLEALVALLLFFMLLHYRKKSKYVGTVFPLYLITYSVSRFFTEFLRDDFPNVLGIFDTYQFQSIAGVVVGCAEMLLIVYLFNENEVTDIEGIQS